MGQNPQVTTKPALLVKAG